MRESAVYASNAFRADIATPEQPASNAVLTKATVPVWQLLHSTAGRQLIKRIVPLGSGGTDSRVEPDGWLTRKLHSLCMST